MVNGDAFERVNYEVPGLADDEVAADPLTQFQRWLDEATQAGVKEPTAMSLATCGPQGAAVRMVLAKAVDRDGVVFYTNLASDKAVEIRHDPRVALLFAWMPQHRQVRFTGVADELPRPIVADYFDTRPRGAQIGAWASPQSRTLASRADLAAKVADIEQRFGSTSAIPVPDHWGGYRVTVTAVEFWQGQPSRLHDRLRFTAKHPGARLDQAPDWQVARLAP